MVTFRYGEWCRRLLLFEERVSYLHIRAYVYTNALGNGCEYHVSEVRLRKLLRKIVSTAPVKIGTQTGTLFIS